MENTIYEITQLMENKDVLKEDLNAAIASVKDVFYQKYINKFQNVIDEQKKIAEENSSKEIQLIKALKPFLSQSSQNSIDTMVELIYKINTAQNIKSEINKVSKKPQKPADTSSKTIHPDGIYEIDDTCLKNNSATVNSSSVTELIFLLMITGAI